MKILMCAAGALMIVSTAGCAPATPTVDPAMIQASAVAAANAMVAMTQAAMPTDTPIPPTAQPSPTFLPSPTLSLFALPTSSAATLPQLPPPVVGAAPTGDPCSNAPMSAKPAGPMQAVKISNDSGGSVILSLYLNKTPFGECGYRGFNLSRGDVISTSLPLGCYFAGAFVTGTKRQTKAFGNGCLSGPGVGVVSVGTETISFNSKR